ncbi:MAG: DUF1801 domain-containing protein [Patescibacteria group bacterium]
MSKEILQYNKALSAEDKKICDLLAEVIDTNLKKSENKIWHAHPVWFLEGNPIVGYHRLKNGLRLMFWSGQSFDEGKLKNEGSFKAAQIFYANVEEVNVKDLKRWLKKGKEIQWDYKNIVKNKGLLNKLK